MDSTTCHDDVVQGHEPGVLAMVHRVGVNMAIWKRHATPLLLRSLNSAGIETLPSKRFSVPSDEAGQALYEEYDDYLRQDQGLMPLFNDMLEVIHLFNITIGHEHICIRVEHTDRTICPKFHTDQNDFRMLTTYLGPGTEWVPEYAVNREALGRMTSTNADIVRDANAIQHLPLFAVAAMKGVGASPSSRQGLVHRSPVLPPASRRLLLCIQPIIA